MENGWQTYHIHCNECYRRRCSDAVGCDMVECVRGCGSLLHACKLDDHNLVCPRAKVACINAVYGCPFVVERKLLSVHLVQCPVAVQCSQSWSRTPRHSNTQYPPFAEDLLDWSLALRDERQLKSQKLIAQRPSFSLMPRFDAKLCWDALVMPCDLQKKKEEEDECSETAGMGEVIPPPKQFSDCGRAVECDVRTRDDALRMQVDLNITRLPVYVPSRHTIHHFSCDQSFRRDEIHSHHENIHNRIICHLGVWMDVHCPLSLYGCPFTRRNLIPCAPRGSRIVFNRQLASFGVETMPLVGAFLGDDLFSCLPVEVVLLILSYLDAFSLMNMALTCHRLRDVCCQILTRHGVVEVVWKRDKYSKKWTDQAKHWFFSSAMSSIQWSLSDEEVVSQHLLNCQYHKEHQRKTMEQRLLLPGLDRRSFEQLSSSLQGRETNNH